MLEGENELPIQQHAVRRDTCAVGTTAFGTEGLESLAQIKYNWFAEQRFPPKPGDG
jgi:hypothetical protein